MISRDHHSLESKRGFWFALHLDLGIDLFNALALLSSFIGTLLGKLEMWLIFLVVSLYFTQIRWLDGHIVIMQTCYCIIFSASIKLTHESSIKINKYY